MVSLWMSYKYFLILYYEKVQIMGVLKYLCRMFSLLLVAYVYSTLRY